MDLVAEEGCDQSRIVDGANTVPLAGYAANGLDASPPRGGRRRNPPYRSTDQPPNVSTARCLASSSRRGSLTKCTHAP